MKILIVSTSHPYIASGKVALFIKHDLEKNGHEVKLLTRFYDNFPENGIVPYYSKFETKFIIIRRVINNRLKLVFPSLIKIVPKYAVQTFFQFIPLLKSKKILRLSEFRPNIIITFFMQGFINYIDLYHLKKKTNALIFVLSPDMAPFTGLCHFSYNCFKYEQTCGKCPAINSFYKHDISWFNLKSKIKYANMLDMIGVYWTDTIGESMKESAVFRNKEVVKVKLPFDLESTYYKPDITEINELRQKFNITMDDFVIAACSVLLSSERKGIKDIIEAINLLVDNKIHRRIVLIVAGKGSLPIAPKVKTINLGFLRKEDLASLFKLSDIFVSASITDVGPETIPLSLACGVPVISYKSGYAKEIIINNKNGFLIEVKDVNGISKKIQTYMDFNYDDIQEFKLNCIESVDNFYNSSGENSLESIIIKYRNH